MPTNPPGNRALRRGRVSLSGQIYLVTTTTRARQPYFTHFSTACAAARCFADPRLLGDATLLAWVLMPDHAHWLLQLRDRIALDDVVNRMKSASVRQVNRLLQRHGALWQAGYHDHAIRAEEDILAVARYVITNPQRAQIAARAGDYPFWGAVWV